MAAMAIEPPEFKDWYNSVPKTEEERLHIEIPEEFQANNEITGSYEESSGTYTLYINANNPKAWFEVYEKGENNVSSEDTISLNVKVDNPDGYTKSNGVGCPIGIDFFSEQIKEENLIERAQDESNLDIAQVNINEDDGSVKIISLIDTMFTDEGYFYFCAAFGGEGKPMIKEYFRCKVVFTGDKVMNLPGNTVHVPGKISVDRIIADDSIEKISSDYDEKTGTLTYKYTGTAKTRQEMNEELYKNVTDKISFRTTINAPEGYKFLSSEPTFFNDNNDGTISVNIGCPIEEGVSDGLLLAPAPTIYWVKEDDSTVVKDEKIKIEFSSGLSWLTDESKYQAVKKEEMIGIDELVEAMKSKGVNLDVGDTNGFVHVSFDSVVDTTDWEAISINFAPPEGAVEFARMPIWDDNKDFIYNYGHEEQMENDVGGYIQDISGFRGTIINPLYSISVKDITVWFSKSTEKYLLEVFYWFDSEENIIGRNYIFSETEPYFSETTTESSAGDPEAPVEDPKIFHKQGRELTCKQYPQVSESGESYYFELNAAKKNDQADEGESAYRVYLPYGFIGKDMTYEKAKAMDLQIKVNHYKNGVNDDDDPEVLIGYYDEYGIYFEVNSFSPFVLNWSEGEDNGGETEKPNETPNNSYRDTQTITIGSEAEKNTEEKPVETEENPSTGAFVSAVIIGVFGAF